MIVLHNGTYYLQQPIRITAEDTASLGPGGRLKLMAAHPGGATLSGGIALEASSWVAVGGAADLWRAPLPLSLRTWAPMPPRFRQLFVDGVRANRSAFNLTGERERLQTTVLTWLRVFTQ